MNDFYRRILVATTEEIMIFDVFFHILATIKWTTYTLWYQDFDFFCMKNIIESIIDLGLIYTMVLNSNH